MARILYISHRIQSLTGWSAEQLCADAGLLDHAILAEDRPAVTEARRSGTHGWRVTFRLTLPDGRERYLEEVATVLDEVSHRDVVGTLSDVTEFRLLESRNALLIKAFQQSPATANQSIALLDETLQFVSVSEAFAACFGRPARELRGQSLDCLTATLVMPAVSDSEAQAGGAPSRSLRQLAQDVIRSHRPTQQRALLSGSDPSGNSVSLELLPLGESEQAPGILLHLHRLPPA